MRRPLSWSMRFALAFSAVFVIGALSAGGVTYVLQSRELERLLAEDVRSLAESLARTAQNADRQDLLEQIDALSLSTRDAATLVGLVDGRTGEIHGNLRLSAPFEGPRRLETGQGISPVGPPAEDAPEAYYAYGIRTGLGTVVAARDEAWIAETGETLLQTISWGLGGALILSIALVLVIARRNERRIVAMEQVLEAVGSGRLDLRIRDDAGDDLARVAGRVDVTLDRLASGVAAIRQVTTDVAHDLRAPLSRLRMRLEPIALDAGVAEPTRHEIGAALAELDGISETFDAILRLARLQSGSVERREDPVDLCGLAREAHDIFEAAAEEAGDRLLLQTPPEPLIVSGDRDLLMQALVNLIDNALRHCPPPARIAIIAEPARGGAALSVRDDGPGIPAADRARVVERFVRLDRSRSTPGTGLGLSLVAAIADLHGAALDLSDNAPGLDAGIVFPSPD